jgi:XTP/dITP diphosphohydrolase
MKMKLVFATNNKHKIEEIKEIIGDKIELLSLSDIGCTDEIPEDFDTLEANASQKAFYIYNKYKINCFADDTGLEIYALNGKPGVYSARYSEDTDKDIPKALRPEANIKKVLNEMQGMNDRNARFRTVISLIENGKETRFEGIVNGVIMREKHGEKGFGYDPIFQPENYSISFAEMPLDEKNKISHRGLAIAKLIDFLKKNN